VSRYAEQKVSIEQLVLDEPGDSLAGTCLRIATVYGIAPRMRFDLTVNEFTRDLWARGELEVYGERFWRPYIHVRDVAQAVVAVLTTPVADVSGEVFNVGDSDENYRKLDLVKLIRERVGGEVQFVTRTEDPRDYKVSFAKIRRELGFSTSITVPQGIDELVEALERGAFPDPFAPCYRNIP
jgi:nucleoside-diphosphate-sugar epimerase